MDLEALKSYIPGITRAQVRRRGEKEYLWVYSDLKGKNFTPMCQMMGAIRIYLKAQGIECYVTSAGYDTMTLRLHVKLY